MEGGGSKEIQSGIVRLEVKELGQGEGNGLG